MKIRAWAAKNPKQPLTPFTYEKSLGENDVLIKIKYCSLSKADTFFIDNFWGDMKFPLVPSSDMFGEVVEKGNKVTTVNIGDYVGVGYQVSACLACEYCKQGYEQFCKKQRLIGIHEYGGLAEHIIVNEHFAYKIPPKLQKPEYVSLVCYGLTAYSAITHANLTKNREVGVIGIGNLGHWAVQILANQGYPVTAFTHTDTKQEQLKQLGVTTFIHPLDTKVLKANEGMYDFLLVTTYHSYNWSHFIKLLKPEGTLCFVGLPNENIAFPALLLADYARRKITGSYIGSRKDMQSLLEFAQTNDIKAITQVFPVSEVNNVISMRRENKIPFNAVIQMS